MSAMPLWMNVLVALQAFHVAFLLLHDWVPLGRLNDVQAVRAENPGGRLLKTTLVSAAAYVVGLAATAFYFYSSGRFPDWVRWWLWISYGFLFYGELNAWWIPYLTGAKPERAERYKKMFGKTHAFLAEKNGIRPNTLHAILHVATLATLVVLGVIAAGY
jgi:hypothetical protein